MVESPKSHLQGGFLQSSVKMWGLLTCGLCVEISVCQKLQQEEDNLI